MKHRARWWVLAGLLWLFGPTAGEAAGPPTVGGPLPAFTLTVPKEAAEKAYLGLAGSGTFAIPQLRSQAVVIEIFSMYCPYCQKEAPKVNQLFSLIEADPGLRGKIKVIGIGAGNSPFEVGIFRKKYGVAFPLFPDADFTLHKLLGEVRTPTFIVLKNQPSGSSQVVLSRLGAFASAEAFLAEIVAAAALK